MLVGADPSFSKIFGSNKTVLTPRCAIQHGVHSVLVSVESNSALCKSAQSPTPYSVSYRRVFLHLFYCVILYSTQFNSQLLNTEQSPLFHEYLHEHEII